MLQHLIDLLPDKAAQMPSGLAMGIAAGGILLGVVGARLSRAILALALVAAGTMIGWRMPAWFGWKVDPMGTAFGAAILLGLSGFVLSTLWEAIMFGSLLALGAAIAVWDSLAPGMRWQKPDIDLSATAVEIALRLWHALPGPVSRALPIGIGLGFAIGALLLASWPRIGRALFYSLLGMLLFVLSGTIGLQKQHPDWLASMPNESWAQAALFAALVLIATAVQFLLTADPKQPKTVPESDKSPGPMRKVKPARAPAAESASPAPSLSTAPEPMQKAKLAHAPAAVSPSPAPSPSSAPDPMQKVKPAQAPAAVSPSPSLSPAPSPPTSSVPSPSPTATPRVSPPPPPKWATLPPAAGETRPRPPAARPPNNPSAMK